MQYRRGQFGRFLLEAFSRLIGIGFLDLYMHLVHGTMLLWLVPFGYRIVYQNPDVIDDSILRTCTLVQLHRTNL
jgi:hypothetical protein